MKTAYFDSAAPKVGNIVYPYCQPQKAGRIIAVGQPGRANVVRIIQANATEYDHSAMGLRCFRTLVEEHERKAAKHRAILERITP